jgi:hypothetical protein
MSNEEKLAMLEAKEQANIAYRTKRNKRVTFQNKFIKDWALSNGLTLDEIKDATPQELL